MYYFYSLVGFIFLYLTYRIIWIFVVAPYIFTKKFERQGLKAPPFTPFFGEFLTILDFFKRNKLEEYLEFATENYGLVRPQILGPLTALVVNDPDYIKLIFTSHAQYYIKGTEQQKEEFRPLFRNGLLLSEGAHWTRQRKLIAPAFHFIQLKHMVPLMMTSVDKCTGSWIQQTYKEIEKSALLNDNNSFTVDFSSEMEKLSLDSLLTTCFGSALSDQPSLCKEFLKANHTFHHTRLERAANFIGLVPVLKNLPFYSSRQMKQAAKTMNKIAQDIVNDRADGKTSNNGGRVDLLDLLLAAKTEDGTTMSKEEICEETLTFLTAGENAMAVTVVWTFYYLLTVDGLMDRVCAEVAHVLQNKNKPTENKDEKDNTEDNKLFEFNCPTPETLNNLIVLEAIIYECLRLHPPLPILIKYADKSHKLHDLEIEAGTTISINVAELHKLPSLWGKNAKQFNADRFLIPLNNNNESQGQTLKSHNDEDINNYDSNALDEEKEQVMNNRNRFSFLGFSAGPRKCIGKNFAVMNMKIIISSLLSNFEVSLTPNQDLTKVDLLTNLPKFGMKVKLTKRTNSLWEHYQANPNSLYTNSNGPRYKIIKPLGMI